MGLSSSQARLLSLTGRMHQIEYSAQRIEAQKLQLANKTRRVYEDYLNALEMSKIQHKILNTDGSVTFRDTTFNNFIGTKANENSIYILRDLQTGKVYVPNEIRSAYINSDKTIDGFMKTLNSLISNENASYIGISSAEDLMNISGSNGRYRLDKDLVLENWDGIPDFSGTFDGNGHTITINNSKNGLFLRTNGATLKNIEITGTIKNEDRKYFHGLLAADSKNTTVENCSATGTIHGGKYIGGLIGQLSGNSVVRNSSADVDVYSDLISPDNGTSANTQWDCVSYSGGFIGKCNDNITIENCKSSGNVSSEYDIIGGFLGIAYSGTININNCVSEGNIEANRSGLSANFDATLTEKYVRPSGTFLGECLNAAHTTINNCYAYGMPMNDGGGVQTTYYDFGKSYNATSLAVTNSYSTFANNLPAKTYVVPTSSSINLSQYPNIPQEKLNYYVQMFNAITDAGGALTVDDEHANDPIWFSNIVTNGLVIISTLKIIDDGFELRDTSVAIDTNLQEVQDYSKIRKAEAKYEADMRRIDMKDRKFDYDLAALDNERNAIKQEIETLKTVSKENVERTFKLFS